MFCNSVSADRVVMAASRLLGAAAACVILLSFAAEDCKSYWTLEWLHPGCDSDLVADFRNFGSNNFPFKNPFEKCFKIVFFLLWRRDSVLELQFQMLLRLLCFATQSLESVFHSCLGTSYRTLDEKPRWRCVAKEITRKKA